MRVLVTGARGKVGRALCPRLAEAGYDVRATDLGVPTWDRARAGRAGGLLAGRPHRRRLGLRARSRLRRRRAHGGDPAADPQPAARRLRQQHAEHVQRARGGDRRGRAAVRELLERDRPGFIFAQRPFEPDYLPIDEEHPVRPQDPYATAKWFGELLCDRAVERADIRCTSIRPCWVQDEGSYERNLGPIVRDPSVLIGNYCSYVDVYDLCDAVVLAIETDLPGTRSSTSPRPTRSAGIRSSRR